MDTFTVRDLRERTGELIRDAESGHLSVVTKHGKPVFVAVPFDDVVLEAGIIPALAAKLYAEEVMSIGKAAKFAGFSVAEFTELLAKWGIPSVNYSPGELQEELDTID